MSIDEFVFHDRRVFDAALDGDPTALRHAALLVFTGPDGFQQGNVHVPGSVARLEIPRSFRVRDISPRTGCSSSPAPTARSSAALRQSSPADHRGARSRLPGPARPDLP
ncbi:MAG TPA: hypothetical protein VFX16_04580 [Pseudonocardiaceae bacterium]|nr:hypothetical protein [Pseudonocardiaceae bacterium]